jgi:hypothetical protein
MTTVDVNINNRLLLRAKTKTRYKNDFLIGNHAMGLYVVFGKKSMVTIKFRCSNTTVESTVI